MRTAEQVLPPSAPAPSRRLLRRPEDLLLAAAVAVQAAAMAAWPRVVTVDGAAHLAGADALLQAGEGVHALYVVDWTPVPNMLTTLVLAALLPLAGPDTAERLLVLAYALALPLAARWALRGVHERSGWLALVAVPFTGGYLYAYGFYNFCLGLVGFLLGVGVALRQREGWSWRAGVGLALLLTVTWTAHLLPAVVAGITVALLAVARVLADRSGRSRSWRGSVAAHVVPVVLAGLPVLALTAQFAVASAESRGEAVRTSSVAGLVGGLLTLGRPLVAWTTWEYVGSVLVAAGLGALAVRAVRALREARADWVPGDRVDAAPRRSSPERWGLVAALGVLTLWYLASPDRYGHEYGFLNDRLSYFPPLLLLLAVAGPVPGGRAGPPVPAGRARPPVPAGRAGPPAHGAAPPRAERAGLVGVAAVVTGTVALLALRLPSEVRFQRDVAELLSVAPAVPEGSTLVGLRLWRDAPVGPDARNRARDPLRHEPGRIAVLRDAVNTGHYEAATPYFPARFRPETDPRRAIDPDLEGLEEVPPRVDLTRGPQVVLLIGRNRAEEGVLAAPETAELLAELESAYRPVATSERTGLVEVWQRADR